MRSKEIQTSCAVATSMDHFFTLAPDHSRLGVTLYKSFTMPVTKQRLLFVNRRLLGRGRGGKSSILLETPEELKTGNHSTLIPNGHPTKVKMTFTPLEREVDSHMVSPETVPRKRSQTPVAHAAQLQSHEVPGVGGRGEQPVKEPQSLSGVTGCLQTARGGART